MSGLFAFFQYLDEWDTDTNHGVGLFFKEENEYCPDGKVNSLEQNKEIFRRSSITRTPDFSSLKELETTEKGEFTLVAEMQDICTSYHGRENNYCFTKILSYKGLLLVLHEFGEYNQDEYGYLVYEAVYGSLVDMLKKVEVLWLDDYVNNPEGIIQLYKNYYCSGTISEASRFFRNFCGENQKLANACFTKYAMSYLPYPTIA